MKKKKIFIYFGLFFDFLLILVTLLIGAKLLSIDLTDLLSRLIQCDLKRLPHSIWLLILVSVVFLVLWGQVEIENAIRESDIKVLNKKLGIINNKLDNLLKNKK